jgi:hypothetical protein
MEHVANEVSSLFGECEQLDAINFSQKNEHGNALVYWKATNTLTDLLHPQYGTSR